MVTPSIVIPTAVSNVNTLPINIPAPVPEIITERLSSNAEARLAQLGLLPSIATPFVVTPPVVTPLVEIPTVVSNVNTLPINIPAPTIQPLAFSPEARLEARMARMGLGPSPSVNVSNVNTLPINIPSSASVSLPETQRLSSSAEERLIQLGLLSPSNL